MIQLKSGDIKKHIVLLLSQAVLLVTLAIIGVGFQLHTLYSQAEAEKIVNPILARQTAPAITEGQPLLETGGQTLGETTLQQQESTNEPSNEPESNTSPQYPPLPKKEYTIAVFGDSMVDTMGERLEYLDKVLSERYPDTTFKLYNYGIGSQNIKEGLERWDKPFRYMDRSYPPVAELKPDIFIAGSFAYNVFTPHQRDTHWLAYTELVQRAQKISPHVFMLAEIAPVRQGFGFGPNGVNWEPSTAWEHTGKIIEQLDNVVGLSETLQVKLINAYHASLREDRHEGRREFVNPSDNIHPSVEGHIMMATVIADRLFE